MSIESSLGRQWPLGTINSRQSTVTKMVVSLVPPLTRRQFLRSHLIRSNIGTILRKYKVDVARKRNLFVTKERSFLKL